MNHALKKKEMEENEVPQHQDNKIPQRSVLIMLPYNIPIENSGPSYKHGLPFFQVVMIVVFSSEQCWCISLTKVKCHSVHKNHFSTQRSQIGLCHQVYLHFQPLQREICPVTIPLNYCNDNADTYLLSSCQGHLS